MAKFIIRVDGEDIEMEELKDALDLYFDDEQDITIELETSDKDKLNLEIINPIDED